MIDGVYDELGMKPKQIGAYFKCPSDDLAGLGEEDPILAQALQLSQEPLMMAATNTAPMEERYGAWDIEGTGAPTVPQPISTPTQNLLDTISQTTGPDGSFVSKPNKSLYTYRTPPGQFVGPMPSSGSQATSNAKDAADALAAVMKGATPAAQAYLQMQAAQAMAQQQPIHVPVPYGQQSLLRKSSTTMWVIGGLALLAVVGLVAFSKKR